MGRQINLAETFNTAASGPSVNPDAGSPFMPALMMQLTAAWATSEYAEAWYDANGIPLAYLYEVWDSTTSSTTPIPWSGPPYFQGSACLFNDDGGVLGGLDVSDGGLALGASGSNTVVFDSTSDLGPRLFGSLSFGCVAAYGATVRGVTNSVYATAIGVYGTHGLALHYTLNADGSNNTVAAKGVLVSDVLAHCLSKWCPDIAYSTTATLPTAASIQPSTFVIPQLVFTAPTTMADMLKSANAYELMDWAPWDGPVMYLNERGAAGRSWCARIGPAQLQDAGPQMSRIYNGVIVSYTDVSGLTRTVGPIGSGANYEDASLSDPDPTNPCNQAGIRRWALTSVNLSTQLGGSRSGKSSCMRPSGSTPPTSRRTR